MSVTDIGSVYAAPPGTNIPITGLAPIGGVFRNASAFPPAFSPPQFAELLGTPHGDGYSITCTDSDPQPWPDYTSLKAVLTKTPVDDPYFGGAYEGKTDVWDGYFMLPSSGNAGLPSSAYWQPGTLWEYHTNFSSGMTFGLDSHWYPGRYNLRATYPRYDASGQAIYDYYVLPPDLQFDHWYHFTWTIKWSYTNTGAVSLKFDGVYPKGLDLPGTPDYNLVNVPTMLTHLGQQEGAWVQFGWYGARLYGTPSNQVQFSGMTLSRT